MDKAKSCLLTACLSLLLLPGICQQVADTLYSPIISSPVYEKGEGPMVLIDEAHANFHTAGGRFRPFVNVLEKDGYMVESSLESFTKEQLRSGKILVIANALHPSNLGRWVLPTPSAFTDTEIALVREWVNGGGSLFLIADHMPFAGAAEKLAASFGFQINNGFAIKKGGKDIFTPGDGLIVSAVTRGRNSEEMITTLQTFTGMAFQIPEGAQAIIKLSEGYEIKLPEKAWEFTKDTPTVPGEGLFQGAYMPYGKGRIMIFGEAAMFTAQLQGNKQFGMNAKSASQNAQFLLNAIHWLDGIIR